MRDSENRQLSQVLLQRGTEIRVAGEGSGLRLFLKKMGEVPTYLLMAMIDRDGKFDGEGEKD